MSLLLDLGADVNSHYELNTGWTPLHEAACSASTTVVDVLLSRGAWVDPFDEQMRTPLAVCMPRMPAAIAEALIRKGAEVQVTWLAGVRLLQWAALQGKLELVKMILQHGELVNARDKCFRTALHYAVMGGSVDTVRAIIVGGAWVSARDRNGTTPLHEAAWFEQTDIARVLLEAGADTDAKQCSGLTPLDIARKTKNEELITLLQEYRGENER